MTHLLDWDAGDLRPVRLATGCLSAVTGWDLYSSPMLDGIPPLHPGIHPGAVVRSLLIIQDTELQHALGVVLILFGFLLISTSFTAADRH